MSFPSIVSRSSVSATTGSNGKTVTFQSGITAGNTLALIVSTTNDYTYSLSGWSLVNRYFDSSYTARNIHVFKKTASGSEGGTTADLSGGAGAVAGAFVCYELSGAGGDIEAAFAGMGFSAQPNPPSLSPSWGAADALAVAFASGNSSANPSAAPSGYSDYAELEGVSVDAAVAHKQITASSEDPGAFTGNNSSWVCTTVAIKGLAAAKKKTLLIGNAF